LDDVERLSRLIGEIYDAALDPERWPQALEGSCAFLNGMAGSIGSADLLKPEMSVTKYWGFDDAAMKSFLERHGRTHPLIPAALATRTGDVYTFKDLMPYEEFAQTAVFREFLKPYGIVDAVQATLEHTATAMAAFYVVRHERVGMVDDEMRRRMALLAPHVRRAVLIGKVVNLHRVQPAALADTFDGLEAGMFMVTAAGRIAHANASGKAMLAGGELVRSLEGRLSLRNPQADQALQDICAAAANGDAAVGTRGIDVPFRSGDGKRFVAHVLPLTSGARRQAGTRYSAVAAVFVREASIEGSLPLDVMARHYGLTPAETRVLFGVLNVGGITEMAPVLGISENTVKTLLQRVFEKTGTNRQADLVKLAAGFASPLRAPPQ
jgi:DNA-binding CsgD family transcriptional regulator